MPTIYRRNSERISVTDAKQLILNALPIELGGGQIFGKPGPDGEPIWDFDSLAQVSAAEAHAPYLDSHFLELCKGLGFEPHMMFSPAIGGYRGPHDDNTHMLTHTEFVKLAEKYSLSVEIGTARPAPAQSPAEPAPVATESASNKPGSREKWTPEKKSELQAYRESHTMPQTAAKFGISEQRIRQLLPRANPKKTSPFPGVIYRTK